MMEEGKPGFFDSEKNCNNSDVYILVGRFPVFFQGVNERCLYCVEDYAIVPGHIGGLDYFCIVR
jgi:hypothetical protein